jgi:integrating conjugative element protein (TIGR03765 family)
MKVKDCILLLLISCNANALITFADTGNTKAINDVMQIPRANFDEKENKMVPSNALGLPVKSKVSQGYLVSKKVDVPDFLKNKTMFIVGGDVVSIDWLASHKEYFKRNHAVGFITNINDYKQYQKIINEYDLPLQPANVDDLMKVIKTDAYPVYFDGESIWQ